MTNLKKLVPLTERNNQPTMNMENGEVTAVNPIQPNTDADVIAVNPIQPDEDAIEVRPFPLEQDVDVTAVHPIQPDEDADVIAVNPIQPDEDADVIAVNPIQPDEDADVTAVNPIQPDEDADVIAVNPIQPQEDAVCVWPSNDDVAPVNPIQPGPTYAENGNDTIDGGTGDDTIEGGAGNDLIEGGGGADQIFGNDGDDTILASDGFGSDTVVGSEVGETNGDTLDLSGVGAEGVSIVYSGSESGIVTGSTTGDTIDFSGIENVTATDNDDTIDATLDTVGVNVDAGAGDDLVSGGSGSDTIDGGAGSDTISGGADGDLITAGAGDDTINVAQGDTVTGGDGDDFFNIVDLGEIDTDTITITGGEGDETNGDTLALNGLHDRDSLTITDPDDVNGGLSGTVTLLDGTIINFTNIENIICFVPGTEIATPFGARMIEDLSIGDQVVTQDNGVQRIRWIGKTTVPADDRFAPIRFAQSTFPGANGDLIVSPQHRMLFKGYQAELLFGENEVLIPAIHLLDGQNVTREDVETVTYIHIMFEQHEIIFAQGVATESFHPGSFGVECLAPKAREELFTLFPQMRADLSTYGQSARRTLRAIEAKVLKNF